MLQLFKKSKKTGEGSSSPDVDQNTAVLQSFSLPNKESKLEDRIANHVGKTDQFKYVSIVAPNLETKLARYERILASRPKVRTKEIDVDDIPIIALVEKKNMITIIQSLPKNYLRTCKSFILLKEASIHFGATQGFFDPYSKVVIGLHDDRMVENKVVRTTTIQSNSAGTADMALDYYVHKNDLYKICLMINCENSPLEAGNVWGSVQVSIKLKEADAAMPAQLLESVGILEIPESAMEKPETNPYHENLTYDTEDLATMREMYEKGLIIDTNKPAVKNRRLNIKGTTYGGNAAGSDIDEKEMARGAEKVKENFLARARMLREKAEGIEEEEEEAAKSKSVKSDSMSYQESVPPTFEELGLSKDKGKGKELEEEVLKPSIKGYKVSEDNENSKEWRASNSLVKTVRYAD